MQTYPVEEFQKFWSAHSVALRPLSQSTLRIWEECGRQQLKFINLCTEWGDREWQMLKSAKSPLEMFTAQSAITVEFSMRLAEHSRYTIGCMTEATKEIMVSFGWSKPYWTMMPSSKETTRYVRASKAAA
jgi:hypothetical protein